MRSGCWHDIALRTAFGRMQRLTWLAVVCAVQLVCCAKVCLALEANLTNLSLSEYQKQEWQVEDRKSVV